MNKLIVLVFLVGCGDGVTFGGNLMPGGMMKFEENWIGLAEDSSQDAVSVEGRSYFGLAKLAANETEEYTFNPDNMQVDDGMAWYERDEDATGGFSGAIYVSDEDDAGEVGRKADGLYRQEADCTETWMFEYDQETRNSTLLIDISGDYLILMENGPDVYTNMDGWKVADGRLVISGDPANSPIGTWCLGTLYVYADPPEEDADPWDGK